MLILGIETSCDETGVALYDSVRGLLGQALHSQVAMHRDYGGVVPELASRDHIRRIPRMVAHCLAEAGQSLPQVDGVAYTAGPGLAGALLVGASVAHGISYALGVPAIPVHHLEGHLLAPFLTGEAPPLPFVALLVSGGHTQLMRVVALGQYELLGETLDDAAGEAFDKTAQMLGLGYPGGPALARLAMQGNPDRFSLPRPMLHSATLDFSFSGLKTAVLTVLRKQVAADQHADLAAAFQEAAVDVLVAKCTQALAITGTRDLVIAGGVGANLRLRERLDECARARNFRVHYPDFEYCTDNGAMIAFAGALRMAKSPPETTGFGVRPRWDLHTLPPLQQSS